MPLSVTSEVPTPHLDGKNGHDVTEVTAYFKFQALPNSCVPTCIRNVLKALAVSHNYPAIALSEARVNQLCRYRLNFGPIMIDIVPNLNKILESYGYRAYGQVGITYDAMVKTIQDKESSYPIIELSHKYLDDRRGAAEELGILNPPDHVIIVLSSDANETVIFDPFDTRSKTMQARPDRIGNGLYLMSTTKITEYWEHASTGWAFWISRKAGETTKPTVLEQYVKGEAK